MSDFGVLDTFGEFTTDRHGPKLLIFKCSFLENADACLSFLLVIMKGLGVLYGMNVEWIYVYVKMSEKMGSFVDIVLKSSCE